MKSSIITGLGLSAFIGAGVLNPDPVFLGMMTTFTLAAISGYQSVWSVTPALHTPLMSVTNAVSGLTAAGGLLILGGGFFPGSIGKALGASAVFISSGNIAGGFIVTKRMLDMFKRKDDLPEYNYLYGIGGGAMIASLYAAHRAGVPHIYSMGYLASSICCLAAISGLSA